MYESQKFQDGDVVKLIKPYNDHHKTGEIAVLKSGFAGMLWAHFDGSPFGEQLMSDDHWELVERGSDFEPEAIGPTDKEVEEWWNNEVVPGMPEQHINFTDEEDSEQ